MKNVNPFFKLILFLLVAQNTYAQHSIEKSYTKYFQDTREIPYLHLNKTSFFNGEEVWFQAYVMEQNTNQLHKQTSNLYLSIFDEQGRLKDQHLIHIKNGIGKGNFLVDSTFTQSKYFLKASTKWMKNFNENNAFTQRINIVKNGSPKQSRTVNEEDFYEFNLFPEGGHVIANSMNNIAFLIKDVDSKGVIPKEGVIKDSNDRIVKRFTTNQFGIGLVNLPFVTNQQYTFEATLDNGITIRAQTPKPRLIGLSTNIEERENSFSIQIFTNNNSLQYFKNKEFTVFIHNTRKFIKFPLKFSNNTLYELEVPKEKLSHGVQVVTIFNDSQKPILERLIYHENKQGNTDVLIRKGVVRNDSMQISILNNSEEKVYLSSSFLPKETQAYNPNQNLISTVLLKPYVRGYIQNPHYYFDESNTNRQKDLHLLLMTQGWSKFNWSLIFKNPNEKKFEFENGITITAKFNQNSTREKKYILFSPKNNLIREISSLENPFYLKNTFIKKNSIFNFGLKERNNVLKIGPALQFSNASLVDKITSMDSLSIFTEIQMTNFEDIKKGTEVLNEIVITAKKRKEMKAAYAAATMLRRYAMDDILIPSGLNVFEWLRIKGFGRRNLDGFDLLTPRNSFTSSSFSGSNSLPSIMVRVFLDGSDISESIWILDNMYLDEFREIYFGRNPGRIGEEIHLFRVPPNERNRGYSNFANIKVPVGFLTEKEYYSPKYPSYLESDFKMYGALYWKPDMEIEANKSLEFTVPLRLQNGLKMFVEGCDANGKFVSKSKIF